MKIWGLFRFASRHCNFGNQFYTHVTRQGEGLM